MTDASVGLPIALSREPHPFCRPACFPAAWQPFVLSALGVPRLTGALSFFRSHQQAILWTSGGLLVSFGLVLSFNRLYVISAWIQRGLDAVGLEELIGI